MLWCVEVGGGSEVSRVKGDGLKVSMVTATTAPTDSLASHHLFSKKPMEGCLRHSPPWGGAFQGHRFQLSAWAGGGRAVLSPVHHCSSPSGHRVEISSHGRDALNPGSFPRLCPFPLRLPQASSGSRTTLLQSSGEPGAEREDPKYEEQGLPASGEGFFVQSRLGQVQLSERKGTSLQQHLASK